MKVEELLKISIETLKLLSKCDIRTNDWKFLEMYDLYNDMRRNKEKFRYIIAYLANKYKISESSVKRIIKRFSSEVVL